MTVADIILFTIAATLTAAAIAYFVIRMIARAWRFLHEFVKDIRDLTAAMGRTAMVMAQMRDELAYQRQMVTAANPQLGELIQVPTSPPIGQASYMPGEFPKRPWESYQQPPAPDAKKEDTDMGLVEQTDEDLMVAQERFEKIEKGIEPDDDYGPRPAVREEA